MARFRFWLTKGTLAVLDQGLFSGANFLVNILLARWLSPEEYGAFAVALSVFYLLAGFHTAVLTEPMVVFGAGKYKEHFRKYLGMLLYGHFGLSAVISLALGMAALVTARYGSQALARALAGLAIASPFLLLLWLTRRGCYVHLRPTWAVVGSGMNLVLVMAGLFLFWRQGLLSPLTGLVLLGAAAGGAALLNLLQLRPQIAGFVGNPTPLMIVRDHRGYGTWNLLGVLAYWASGQVLMLLVPIFLGLAASAVVAAVWNLYRPVSLFIQSLGFVLLPLFSRWVSEGVAPRELRRWALRLAFLFGGAVLIYGILLTLLAKPVLDFLYAGKYVEHWLLVGMFGLSTTASTVTGMFVLLLKAKQSAKNVSTIWVLSLTFMAIVSFPMMYLARLEGALIAFTLSYLVATAVAFLTVRRLIG